MKKLLIVPFMAVMLTQFVSLPAWSHSMGWYQRHENRMYFNAMNSRCGGYGYNRGYIGYPRPYGYGGGVFGGVHRFFTGY